MRTARVAVVRTRPETVIADYARVMDLAEAEFSVLDRISVTTGPGSFTGLRVGISAARGISLASGKPAIGLSTLSGFAAPHIAEDDSTNVVVAIDARHDNVYLQIFGIGGRTLVAPRIAPVREAVRAAMTGPARLVGSAAGLLAAAWPKSAEQPLLVDHELLDLLVARPSEPCLVALRSDRNVGDRAQHVETAQPIDEQVPAALRHRLLHRAPLQKRRPIHCIDADFQTDPPQHLGRDGRLGIDDGLVRGLHEDDLFALVAGFLDQRLRLQPRRHERRALPQP